MDRASFEGSSYTYTIPASLIDNSNILGERGSMLRTTSPRGVVPYLCHYCADTTAFAYRSFYDWNECMVENNALCLCSALRSVMSTTSGGLTSGKLTSGGLTSGKLTRRRLTSGRLTSGRLTSGRSKRSFQRASRTDRKVQFTTRTYIFIIIGVFAFKLGLAENLS